MFKVDCKFLKPSVNPELLKEQTQIFILFMDIQAALYHTWFCSNVNCTKEKREGKTFEWAMKKAEKNVNTAGKKDIKYFKKICDRKFRN